MILAILAAAAPFAQGQTTALPFTIRLTQATNVQNLADGATISFAADAVGLSSSATVALIYRGTQQSVSINAVDYTGSTDFSVTGVPELPLTVAQNGSMGLGIRYAPTTSNRVQGRIVITYLDGRTAGTITLNLTGVAPEFGYSYVPQGGNAMPLSPGSTITLPQTAIEATSSAAVILTNRGSGTGLVNSISGSGAAFQFVGLPLPNTQVEAGKELRFTVNFTPKTLESSTGAVQIDLPGGRVAFNLEGTASGAVFAYEMLQGSAASPLQPNGVVAMPDAVVGEKSTVAVRVKNTGNAEGRITSIAVSGPALTLTDLPFLPLVLPAGGSATATITFTPTQAGRIAGRLRIGNDSFDVTASGLGPVLAYGYSVGSATTSVAGSGSVIFTPVDVGRTTTVRFLISNTGTAPVSVGSISVTATGTVFTLSDLPAFPVSVRPEASVPFTITFAPTAIGSATGTLRIDTQSFTLSGTGNPPAALPEYRIDGASGAQEPMTQPAVGLLLSQAYPLALSGTLTMNFNSDVFANDPSVQFAAGGRTVSFTIPANTTRAMFPNGANQVRLQTGTVAGTITLTPSFATDGGINLTPANPASLNLSVAQSAPRLMSVQVTAKTSSGFSLLVTGYATARALTQMDFTFTPTTGENVQTTKLSLNVEPSFIAWYQSSTSQPYGSMFTATVPFTMQGDLKNVSTLVDSLQSVSVTITNRQGTSAARSVDMK